MEKIKLLIFDLDNTLINYGGVTRKAWELTCINGKEKYGFDCDVVDMVDEIMRVNDQLWEDEKRRPKGNFSFYELRMMVVKEALFHLGIEDNMIISDLVLHYDKYKEEAIYVFEDVFSTLEELKKRGYLIALLTNGDSQTQRKKLKRFKMEKLFDGIFIDGEQGVGKPEKEAYDNVLNHFHILANEACMIGDHYLWEVVAPKTYGLKAIWVNRGKLGLSYTENIEADRVIKNICELLDIL